MALRLQCSCEGSVDASIEIDHDVDSTKTPMLATPVEEPGSEEESYATRISAAMRMITAVCQKAHSFGGDA